MSGSVSNGHALRNFARQLGTASDFVRHVQEVEGRTGSRAALLRDPAIGDFTATSTGKRYLVVKRGMARVLDFRHFFAATAEACLGVRSRVPGREVTLLLGLANEIYQCAEETHATASHAEPRFNSCFAREDLGSNRLGAEFGRHLTIADATMRAESTATLLAEYLAAWRPASAPEVARLSAPSNAEVALEALVALLTGAGGLLITDAY